MHTLAIAVVLAVGGFLFCLRWPMKGLYGILFLLPFSFALNPLPGIDLQLLRIVVPAWWIAVLLKHPRDFFAETKKPLALLLWLFLCIATVSLFFAMEPFWSLRKLIYLWSLAPFFPAVCVLARNVDMGKYIKPLFLGATIASVVGVVQFVSQFFVGTETLFHFFVKLLPYTQGTEFGALVAQYPSWFVDIGGNAYLRAFAFFPDPHIFAFYLVIVSALTLALLLGAQNKKSFVLFVTRYALLVTCLLLTFSRGGYMGFLAGTAVVFALLYRRISRRATLLLASGVVAVVVLVAVGAPVIGRLASSFDVAEGSNASRISIWRDALEKVYENPLGIGIGNYAATAGAESPRSPITAHNLYLDVLAETGFLGLAAYLGFLALAFYSLLRSWRFADRSSTVRFGVFGALMGFSTHAFFENPLWAPAVFILVLFLSAGTRSAVERYNGKGMEKGAV